MTAVVVTEEETVSVCVMLSLHMLKSVIIKEFTSTGGNMADVVG